MAFAYWVARHRGRFCGGGNGGAEGDGEGRNFEIGEAVGGIEGSVLICAIAEGVLEVVVGAEASSDDGRPIVVGVTPSETEARLWEELSVVDGEGGAADGGLSGDDAVGESVSGGAAVDFVPAGGEFVAETEGEGEVFVDADDILA